MLLDKATIEINDTKSILSFETESGGSWEAWDRYLTIEGKKAFHIGNVCGTCSFFFERLEGAKKTPNPEEIVKSLNTGINKLEESFINVLGKIIPNGKYIVTLSEVIPILTKPSDSNDYFSNEQVKLLGIEPFFGLPHYPRTEYYRSNTFKIDKNTDFYEFIIPTFPHGWLDVKRVEEYRNVIKNEEKPSIVTIGVLDIKAPEDYNEKEDINCHWCLANYLVDGHHKTYAAALEKKPLTMISFLAVEQGVSSKKDINKLLELMLNV